MEYVEKRSAHALTVDRAIQAQQVYDEFNQPYSRAPNETDVQFYDTRRKSVRPEPVTPTSPPLTPAKAPEKHESQEGVYTRSGGERYKLVDKFHKSMTKEEQHKDLLVTKNVIKRKEDVKKWEANPKWYDVQGIDTQPRELVHKRIQVAHRMSGSPAISYRKSLGRSHGGVVQGRYEYSPVYAAVHQIKLLTSKKGTTEGYQDFAHEVGHAYDRMILRPKNSTSPFRSGNISFGRTIKTPKFASGSSGMSFGKANNLLLKIGERQKTDLPKILKLRARVLGYDIQKSDNSVFRMDRMQEGEVFADWFSGLITHKSVTKKGSGSFYNVFKKSNKELFRSLRASDREVTRPYIG